MIVQMWDKEDTHFCGVNVDEALSDMFYTGLANPKIPFLEDIKHDGSAVGNRVMRKRAICLMEGDEILEKSSLDRGHW